MTTHSRLDGIPGDVSADRNSSILWSLRHSLEWLSTRHRIPLPSGMAGRSVPCPRPPREKPDRAMTAPGRAGMRNGCRFRIPALRSVSFRGSGLLWRRVMQGGAAGKLTVLRAGASSGRPPRVITGAGDGSAHGGQRDRCEHGGAAMAVTGSGVVSARSRPVSAGAAETHARPPRARAAARVLRGAQRAPAARPVPLLPALLLAAAADPGRGLRGGPALPDSRLRKPYSDAYRVVPFYCR